MVDVVEESYRKITFISTDKHELILYFSSFWKFDGSFFYRENKYQIKASSLLSNQFQIFRGDIQVGDISVNWKVDAVVRLQNNVGLTKLFTVKAGRMFDKKFYLTDFLTNEILILSSKFVWKRFNFNHYIYNGAGYLDQENDIDLELLQIMFVYTSIILMRKKRRRNS